MSGESADPASGRLLLAIPHNEADNHNGGQLQFAPDGKLWLGTGDGGGGNNQFGHAQDPASLLGKLIRLDAGARRRRRSWPSGCATRGGSRSTASPASS